MPSVTSSTIAEIEHDAPAQELRVRFHKSGWYVYQAVPLSIYRAFLDASSKGKFFASTIRNKYQTRKA